MGSVEAAASLFGSSDSGSDLDFLTAPEGPNSASDSPSGAGAGSSDELFASQDSSNLFDAVEDGGAASSLFETQGETGTHAYDQNGTHAAQAEVYPPENAYGYGQEAQSTSDYNGGAYNGYDEGWYDEHGQWHAYEQQGTTGDTADNAPLGPAESYGSATNVDSYNGYSSSAYGVQTSNNSSAYGYQPASSYVPSSTSTLSNYDPYKPATPVVQQQINAYGHTTTAPSYDTYKPSGATSQQVPTSSYSAANSSPYEPYRPAISDTRSAPAAPPSGPTQSSSFASGGTLIPPRSTLETSKPPASPYRPSTLNAYDPPLPAIKPKKSMTASALQYQSSPYSPQGATSPPPPPPVRSVVSPPRGNASLPSGPPPSVRSPVYSPPKSSAMSYEQPSSSTVERSSSPYDPPLSRQQEPPKSYAYANHGHVGHSQLNGRYSSPVSTSTPDGRPAVEKQQTSYFSGIVDAPQEEHGSRRTFAPNHVNNSQVLEHEVTDATITQSETFQGQHVESVEESLYAAGPDVDHLEAVELGASSRPTSPQLSSSPRKTHQSTFPERRARMSPDIATHSGSSQRAISPVSESGRSHPGSIGRSSPATSRTGTVLVGQTFSALDEQSLQHSEPYSFITRSSLDRVGSPGTRSAASLGGYAVPPPTLPPSSYLSQDQTVVDLSSDSSSVYGRPISPPTQPNFSVAPSTAVAYDSYKPKPSEKIAQTVSPEVSLPPAPPPSDPYSPSNQYASPRGSFEAPPVRERSMSNMSSFSASSAASYDPYSPSAQPVKRQDPAPYAGNSYNVPPAAHPFSPLANGAARNRTSLESSYSPPPVTGPYAPSPSLLGTNDPLGRASAKVPVVSFGFGGKLVTCFHSPPTLETGFDVALSSRKCTDVHIRSLHKAIPESALDVSSAAYPGPLFGDPGSPVTTLVRTTTSANVKSKTKKAKVLTYLDERAEELEKGLGYLTVGSVDKRRADGKLALVRLLRAMVEYDGQLHGSPAAESAARTALLPRLANSQDATGSNAFLNAPTGASLASGAFGLANSNEKPLVEYAVRPSALETLQDFLLRGEKRKAYHYALDEKMWAHAMVISSSIDKDAFKEVVSEFIRTELGVKAGSGPEAPVTNGQESLRLAYSLYSGQSSTAVQHLFPTKSLQAGPSLTLQPPTPMNNMTPLSPNFPPPSLATNIPPEILSQWQEYTVMLFSGQMGTESSSALTTLGDYLLSNDWVEAAHCCYLLSPQSSPIGGVGAPSVRIVLVGSHSPHRNVLFSADPDAFIFSEIAEFALSLHNPAKGQEVFTGFPHLQAYRLIRALQLAEMGQNTLAKRYCEAITGAAFRPSPYFSQLFSDQLKELYNRLNGVPELDKANSWIGGKIAKPSLDSIGDWLGGTLSKFVAGEAEPSSPVAGEHPSANSPAYSGAFSRFSNISSTNNSRGPSPAPSFANVGAPSSSLPGRAGSAMTVGSISAYTPNNRSLSAMDYERPDSRKDTPPPRVFSADSKTTSQSLSQAMTGYSYGGSTSESHLGNGSAGHQEEDGKPQEAGWWSSAYGDASTATPTASSFLNAGSQATSTESGSGFISLMDDYNSFTPSPSATASSSKKVEDTDDLDDDLGLSNSASKKKEKQQESEDDTKAEKEDVKEVPKKPDIKPNASSSSSWLGRWFSRPSSTNPGPVKANLGEETTFYYDKELKKWVNKKAGAEPSKPAAPPPPPSRAQTASPSRSMHPSSFGPPPPSPLPPPGRPLSAMDAGSSLPPRRTIQRVRSNLIPEEGTTASAPSTPAVMSSSSGPPPTGRPKSAAKKSVRSRYVDVFQQPS